MRIVGGEWRGRALLAPTDRTVRPTSDRTRESVFNILAHAPWVERELSDCVVLDVCCGTGALALEALSRGAPKATFLDLQRSALTLARENAQNLGATSRCRFVTGDALRPPKAQLAHDLVFIDPPYHKGLADGCLIPLKDGGWLASQAILMVETATDDPFVFDAAQFTLQDTRQYGDTTIRFLQVI